MNVFYVNTKSTPLLNLSNRGWGASGNVNLFYRVSNKFSISYSSALYLPAVNIQGRAASNYHYTFAGTVLLLKNLNASIQITNFLKKNITMTSLIENASFKQVHTIYQPVRSFSLSISYSISKLKENVSRKKGVRTTDVKTLN